MRDGHPRTHPRLPAERFLCQDVGEPAIGVIMLADTNNADSSRRFAGLRGRGPAAKPTLGTGLPRDRASWASCHTWVLGGSGADAGG